MQLICQKKFTVKKYVSSRYKKKIDCASYNNKYIYAKRLNFIYIITDHVWN